MFNVGKRNDFRIYSFVVFKKVETGIRGSINFTIHSKTSIQCLLSARHFTSSKVTAA